MHLIGHDGKYQRERLCQLREHRQRTRPLDKLALSARRQQRQDRMQFGCAIAFVAAGLAFVLLVWWYWPL